MNSSKTKAIFVDLCIGDQLTSISCGHVVVELIKFIAYQRQQIPYAYSWLKQLINNRRDNHDEDVNESFQSELHYRVASSALENLDFILKSLLQEMNGSPIPDEICIVVGSTPVTCREVYRLLMPSACHRPQCHSALIASDQKIQRTVFRNLVTAEDVSQVFFSPLLPTNLNLFIKKKVICSQDTLISESFTHTSGFRIPRDSKIIVVDFRSPNQDGLKCCNDFSIFGDISNIDVREMPHMTDDDLFEIESNETYTWYQSSYVMKGFQDCVVNGSSVTNMWLKS